MNNFYLALQITAAIVSGIAFTYALAHFGAKAAAKAFKNEVRVRTIWTHSIYIGNNKTEISFDSGKTWQPIAVEEVR